MLDWLMEEYLPNDSRVILATGHLHEAIYKYVAGKDYQKKILFSFEKYKMGTGGAIINAANLIQSEEFIVLNGDTIQEVKMSDFLKKSILKRNLVINIGCSKSNIDDSGKIIINKDNFIVNFSEKKIPKYSASKNLRLCTSLGMYRCKSEYFKKMPPACLSLEDEILPQLVINKKASASIFDKSYFDFGTLDRYREFINNNF